MRTDYKSGRSFLNHETIALDDVLISVFNKDMGLHFLTYFPGTFFGSLAIKKGCYRQYSYYLALGRCFKVFKKWQSKFDCLVFEMLYIRRL